MIILRQKQFSLEEEIDRLRIKHPNWSENQIKAKLEYSSKADKLVSKMGNKSKPKVTKFVKHSVHFSDTTELEQRNFNKVGDWLKGNTEKDRQRMKNRYEKWADEWIIKHGNTATREEAEKVADKYLRRTKNINKLGKAAMIATPIAVAGGTALALRKKK